MDGGVRGEETHRGCSVGGIGQASCGVVGIAVAVVALVAGYSGVVAVASAVPLLSTTTIVFVGIALWLVTWLVLVVTVDAIRRRTNEPGAEARTR